MKDTFRNVIADSVSVTLVGLPLTRVNVRQGGGELSLLQNSMAVFLAVDKFTFIYVAVAVPALR
jgi:hypothetical protein